MAGKIFNKLILSQARWSWLVLILVMVAVFSLSFNKLITDGIPMTPDDPSFILRVGHLVKYGLIPWSNWWYGGFPLFLFSPPIPLVLTWLFIKIFNLDLFLGYRLFETISFVAIPACFYILCRKYALNTVQSLLATIFFSFAPGIIYMNLAHGQFAQIVSFPFGLLAIGFFHEFITTGKNLKYACLFVVLTILSHLLTTYLLFLWFTIEVLVNVSKVDWQEKVIHVFYGKLVRPLKVLIYSSIACAFFIIPFVLQFSSAYEGAVPDYAGMGISIISLPVTLGIFHTVFITLVTVRLLRKLKMENCILLAVFYLTFIMGFGRLTPIAQLFPLSSVLPGERFFLYALIPASIILGSIVGSFHRPRKVVPLIILLFLLANVPAFCFLAITLSRRQGYPPSEVISYLSSKTEDAKILTFTNSPIWAYDLPLFTEKQLVDGLDPVSRLAPDHLYYWSKQDRLIPSAFEAQRYYVTLTDEYGIGWILTDYRPDTYHLLLDLTRPSELIDQSQTQGTMSGAFLCGNNTQGQTWTTGLNVGNLTKISLLIKKEGEPTGNLTLTIYDSPFKNEVLDVAIKGANEIDELAWYDFSFNRDVEQNRTYYIELGTTEGDVINYFEWLQSENLYRNGESYENGKKEPTWDQAFITYYNASKLKLVLADEKSISTNWFEIRTLGYMLFEIQWLPKFIDVNSSDVQISYSHSPTEITISALTQRNAEYKFTIKDIYTKNWRVRVNGHVVEPYMNQFGLIEFIANLTEGENEVKVYYIDEKTIPSFLASIVGLAFVILLEFSSVRLIRRRFRKGILKCVLPSKFKTRNITGILLLPQSPLMIMTGS
jgi:hypothetical protein